ncbi:MAG: Ig-like domain-containing protein [Oscillospiraceae bacterium]|nr:Ig-like domain-containing protein [Oscillospiraceae bacterium]
MARGTQTALPRDVKVTYESGVTLVKKVTWGAVAAEQYESAGVFTVTGAFEDGAITEPALLNVNVAAVEERKNLGLNTAAGAQDTVSAAGPLATATFTSGTANYPNYMLNGNTTNGWTNAFSASQTVVLAAVAASRPYEYVEMYWPAEQTFDQVSLYFTVDTNNKLPSALNVQYWDGFAWADAGHQEVSFAATSNGETKVTFDAVTSTRVRVGMENATPYNATTGRMRIVKFETWGADLTLRQVIYHANGGTGSLPAEAHFAGAAVTLPAADALTPPEGRRFKEWNTRSDGAGASYEAGATLTVGAADIELFAIWEEAVIALRAAVQGGALWVTLYNSPGETIEGAAIVAFYSPDGRLASAAARSFRIEPDGRLVFEETIPANHAGYDYQVFAWDEAYVPLCDAAAGSLPA